MANDFSNFVHGGNAYVLPGNRWQQAPQMAWVYNLNEKDVPPGFPMQQWNDQSARYRTYWQWWNGDVLTQTRNNEETGEAEIKYPLQINTLRKVGRNHASLLFGEPPDSAVPLVLTSATPKNKVDGSEPKETDISFGITCGNIVNEVWNQSDGRAIQMEGGTLAQFLGGHVFQLVYDPEWNEGIVPNLFIRSWPADFFLPVWSHNEKFELLEAYIICRLEGRAARLQYGYEGNAAFVTYVEHWTKESYSAYIDGAAISSSKLGEQMLYLNAKNPFGFVPFVYIPHLREGSFYGSSHVPDVHGMIREYNERMADLADAIDETMERVTWVRNTQNIRTVELPNGTQAIDLGLLAPGYTKEPDAWINDAPNFSAGLTDYPEKIYRQMRRELFNPPIADGEDEGSQRSGVTLDIRFWPATAHARAERVYWESGLNQMARYILRAVDTHNLWSDLDVGKPLKNFLGKMNLSQRWHPQIPRDREAMVNEYTARLQGGTMSPYTYIGKMGDIANPKQEMKEALEFQKSMAEIQTPKPTETEVSKNNSFAQDEKKLEKA